MMDDDQLESAWLSFADALRENERRGIKRSWLRLTEQRTALGNFGQSPLEAQWQAMAGVNRRQYSQISGLVSGPLSLFGL